MAKKSQPEIKLGATVHLKAQSGEIVEGRVVYLWEEKSVPDGSGCFWPTRLQRSGEHAGRG
jgi:hypothetical protein